MLLTTVGTIGNAAVVEEDILPANMDRHLGIIRPRGDVNPYYLATFLNCKYGRFQTMREATGNVQLNLFVDVMKWLLVPIGEAYEAIGEEVKGIYQLRKKSVSLYSEAEAPLHDALGLDTLDLSHEVTCTGTFRDIENVNRWDCEYWNPKYVKLVKHLENLPHSRMDDVARFSNGATPLGADYLTSGVPFLRIQNVSPNRLNLSDVVYISEETHNKVLGRSRRAPGDVLITITGRIGTAAVIPETLPVANMNQHSVRLRIRSGAINPYYLAAFLNSKAGMLQTEREAYGTSREALPYYCLKRILVPDAEPEIQQEVEEIVLKAEKTRQDAEQLLAEAKRRVEEMILG